MIPRLLAFALLVATCSVAKSAELPKGAAILDPAIVWDPVSVPSFAISPDGKFIAYVSKGAVWVCDVTSGPPTKLSELPNSLTALLAMPENQAAREKFAYVASNPNYTPLPNSLGQIEQFYNLEWTPSQDGVTYTVRQIPQQNSKLTTFRVMHVTLSGVSTQIALIEREIAITPDSGVRFHVMPDRDHVLISSFGIPLIWDVSTNKPQATPFDCLLPSSTSGRCLGVEIDTRQLVLTDQNLHVVKRYDVTLDQDRRCDLFWSRDEHVAVGRSFRSSLEPLGDYCRVFRVDLVSGKRREMKRGIERDRFCFSGHGSEVVRLGIAGLPPNGYGDGTYGSYIEITPDGDAKTHELYRFENPGPTFSEWHRHFYPAILCNSDCTLFAIAMPKSTGTKVGFRYFLMDRGGKKWPFPGSNASQFISPYFPIAFANKDRTIIARTGTELFSLPVKTIEANKEAEDE
jgi:hypothetical protein